jgi:hypothetical protein
MKKSSLNRKFRRALAASLGAVAFASTSCVINSVDQKLIKQREVARYFANPANFDAINSGINVGGGVGAHQADLAAQQINVNHIIIGGEHFALDNTKLTQKTLKKDYEFPMTLNGVVVGTIRLKRQTLVNAAGSKTYRLCPPNDTPIPDPNGIYTALVPIPSANKKVSMWAQEQWKEYYDALDAQIKNLEKAEAKKAEDARQAEENARAERERANSLLSSSGSQNVQVPSTNFNSGIMSASTLAATMIPMTTMMNNTTPVQTTTSSMVNLANTMAPQVGAKTDTTNTNLQINHDSHVAADKIKT